MNPAPTEVATRNLAEILREQARRRPNQPAIIDMHRGLMRLTTFAGLERHVGQAATLLWQSGLRPGDTVLVLQPMSVELYVALIALFRLGLTAMVVDPSAGTEQVDRCCALARPRGFIGSLKAHALRLLVPSLRSIPHMFVVNGWLPGTILWSRADTLVPREDILACSPDTPALLTFTSGSTGQPKAMVRSHGFLLAQHDVLQHNFAATDAGGGVSMTAMPVFVLADLASGTTSLIPPGNLRKPSQIDPAPIVAAIQRYQPRRASASPIFWERIVAWCQQRQVTLPSLTDIYTGGGPVFPCLLDALHACAPRAEIVAVYGSTEAEPIAHVARSDFVPDDRMAMQSGAGLLAGEPVPEIALRILPDRWGTPLTPRTKDEFESACLPAGQPGEIVVSGAHVGSGYVDGRGDAETKLRVDGVIWHRTGDAGYLDEQGRLWLVGRCSARIEDSHGTMYPFAVEAAASAHPVVHRSAMVYWRGQRLLLVEPASPHDNDTLDSLKQSLAWAHLDAIRVVQHIPMDRRHNAKVDYPSLRKLLGTD